MYVFVAVHFRGVQMYKAQILVVRTREWSSADLKYDWLQEVTGTTEPDVMCYTCSYCVIFYTIRACWCTWCGREAEHMNGKILSIHIYFFCILFLQCVCLLLTKVTNKDSLYPCKTDLIISLSYMIMCIVHCIFTVTYFKCI